MPSKKKDRWVIVTTEHRGVFYGRLVGASNSDQAVLEDARMAIYWGTTKGVLELADSGPTAKSRISATAPRIELRAITAVIDVSPAAAAAWEAAG